MTPKTLALTHPWRRNSPLRKHWVPLAFTVPFPPPSLQQQETRPTSQEGAFPSAATPPPPPGKPLTLVQILDTFRDLENPHSRVFGGMLTPDGQNPTAENSAVPMVSGVAAPGSQVHVVFADDAGIPQVDIVVHSDSSGNWLAPLASDSSLLPPRWLQVAITPPVWSGASTADYFQVSFPIEEMTVRQATLDRAPGELIGSVLDASPTEDRFPTGGGW
ncbi:MAG: hypothetical protein ACC661_12010 [Verrucomicrobiales bacterium]